MEEKIVIFVSHSSKDAQFVQNLSDQIEAQDSRLKVFASTRPDSIPSGVDWQEEILANLEAAKVLIILITTPSINSAWVGFELGYFWKKTDGKMIYALYHPTALIPSPLDQLQAKLITDYEQLKNFFTQFGASLSIDTSSVDFRLLIDSANKLQGKPPERSLANFELLLENSVWDKGYFDGTSVWICADDVFFQIAVDHSMEEKYTAEWVVDIARTARSCPVNLNIGGVTFKRLYFINVEGKYFVPLPEQRQAHLTAEIKFYWQQDELYFKVARIIGEFDKHLTIEEASDYLNIKIESQTI